MIEVPYMKELEVIRDVLEEEIERFPSKCCSLTTAIVHKVIGLEMLGGFYYPNLPHDWNYDSERGLYIDLTQDQFDDCEDRIVILPEDTFLLEKNPYFTQMINGFDDDRLSWVFEMLSGQTLEYIIEKIKRKI